MNNPSIKINGSPQPERMTFKYQRFFIVAKKITRSPFRKTTDCVRTANESRSQSLYSTRTLGKLGSYTARDFTDLRFCRVTRGYRR